MATEVTEAIVTNIWLEPKIIIPAISVVLASAIVPILLHWLKGKRERKNKLLCLLTKLSIIKNVLTGHWFMKSFEPEFPVFPMIVPPALSLLSFVNRQINYWT